MSPISLGSMEGKIHPILGSIRSTGVPTAQPPATHTVQPFVTISRQAGAGGRSLAKLLAQRLNLIDPGERPWEAFDRELVEKVAADYHISERLIDSLENSSTSWLQEFFNGLSHQDQGRASEVAVFHRVAATVRALAQAGRVILVGCGAPYIAQNMPGGIHVRLVARFEHRMALMARQENLSLDRAANRVRELDRNREAFYKRYWPDKPLSSDRFTLTLNSSFLLEQEMVDCLIPLVLARKPKEMPRVAVADVAGV